MCSLRINCGWRDRATETLRETPGSRFANLSKRDSEEVGHECAVPRRGLLAVAPDQVNAMDCAESVGYAIASVRQLAIRASETEGIWVDWTAVRVHGLSI